MRLGIIPIKKSEFIIKFKKIFWFSKGMVRELSELCNTYLYSNCQNNERKKSADYLVKKLGYPDKESDFEKNFGKLKYIFRLSIFSKLFIRPILDYLMNKGYDTLMLEYQGQLIGCTAFQIHEDNTLHVFSLERDKAYQGNYLGHYMAKTVVNAAQKKGIKKMRLGGGNNEHTNRIHKDLGEIEGIVSREGNWLDI